MIASGDGLKQETLKTPTLTPEGSGELGILLRGKKWHLIKVTVAVCRPEITPAGGESALVAGRDGVG